MRSFLDGGYRGLMDETIHRGLQMDFTCHATE
jgi:hypothetical protein